MQYARRMRIKWLCDVTVFSFPSKKFATVDKKVSLRKPIVHLAPTTEQGLAALAVRARGAAATTLGSRRGGPPFTVTPPKRA
ncbi:hypothetical protein EVAR_35625_1 [Eumeta japonica]|uniref:Uncharacterized protein n=1 Tax=Eumeta variegata TaxID=151549 RepID=A0A4C1WD78_EUMVA|nr:hypothetical protein EVAR_35625_1 [Eumeta japonica]